MATIEASVSNAQHFTTTGDNSRMTTSGHNSYFAATGDSSYLSASGDSSRLVATGYGSHLEATGNHSRLAATGIGSTVCLGPNGCAVVAWHDGTRTRFAVAYVGENIESRQNILCGRCRQVR